MTFGWQNRPQDDVLHRAGKSGGSYLYVSWNCIFFLFRQMKLGQKKKIDHRVEQRFIFLVKTMYTRLYAIYIYVYMYVQYIHIYSI